MAKIIHKKSSIPSKVPTASDLDYGELALNYKDGKLYFKNTTNDIVSFDSDTSSFVTLTGTQTLTNKTLTSPTITGGTLDNVIIGGTTPTTIIGTDVSATSTLKSLNSVGDEGGEILLAKAQTNTTLSGSVTIDVYQNKLRIFETSGSNRGVYIDLTSANTSVGTNLLGGAVGVTSVDGNAGAISAAQLLTAIKKEDGSGSGLDADLLDGQSGAYYIDWANTTNKPTTLAGYGITDAATSTHNHNGTYQPLDADLTAIAALAGTSGFLKKTAADTWSLDTSTYLTTNQQISVSGDATGSGNTSIALTLANSGVTAGSYGSSTAIPVISIDAKGRITSASTAAISSSLSIAGDTGTDTVTVGTDTLTITGGNAIDTTVTNNVITIDHADTSSVANLSSDNTGNTFIQDISLTFDTYGHVTGASVATGTVTVGNGTLTLATSGVGLSGSASFSANQSTGSTFTVTSNATSDNTASTIVARDASGNFTAGTITATLSGNASTVTNGVYTTGSYADPAWITSINYSKLTGTVPTWNQNTTGSAAKWTTARTLSFTGDATGSGSVDGSANVATALTLANSGVTAGTYTKITVDAKGRATSGTTLAASDIPNLDASKITTGVLDAARLPSYVDDVLEYVNLAGFPVTGETGKIYVALDTNKTYRWSGTAYVYITSGAVDSVAGKTGVVTLVKGDVGLGNVDNTADANKNVLSATKLTTARTISLTGDVTGSVSFDGSGNAAIATTIAADSVALGTDTTGNYVASVATTAPLSGGAAGSEGGALTLSLASGYGDTQNPYASKTANTFLAAPNGAAGVPTFRAIVAADIPTLNQNTTGSAATLTTARTLTIGSTGKTFNGSADVSWSLAEIGAAAASHNHTSLTGVTSIAFAAEASDSASISTTITSNQTFFDFNLTDDNNNDWWRWRFTPSGSTVYDAMTLKPSANGVADLVVAGTVTGTRLISNVANGTAPLSVTSTTLVSNLNADLLDGLNSATAATANTIAARNANGDLTTRYFLGEYTSMSHAAAARTADTVFYSSTDNYIRKNTAAGFKQSLDLNNVENTALSTWAGSTNITTLGTVATGTWNATNIALSKGGTNASLTASLGGVVYSTATELAITSPGTIGQVLTSNGAAAPTWQDAAGGSAWIKKTANYTAVSGDLIIADTSGGAFTITLPASPFIGDSVNIADGANWATTNLTIARNGSTIEGGANDITVDVAGIKLEFVYDGTTWEVFASGGASAQARGGPGDQVFFENGTSVNADYSVTTGMNAMSAGPITIMGTSTVTIPSGSTWTIV